MALHTSVRRPCIPLPPDFTNEDLRAGVVYDTGVRRIADFDDVFTNTRHANVEQKQIRGVMPTESALDIEDRWRIGQDAWTRQSDRAVIVQCWDMTDAARERILAHALAERVQI